MPDEPEEGRQPSSGQAFELNRSSNLAQGSGEWIANSRPDLMRDLINERYRYILQQIHVVNENVYRFLAIYQGLVTALAAGQVLLFVNHSRWGLNPSTARTGLLALLIVETTVAFFAIFLVVIGLLTWVDYRNEECDVSDMVFGVGFRSRPKLKNWYRWYEPYIIFFVVLSIGLLWGLVEGLLVPGIS